MRAFFASYRIIFSAASLRRWLRADLVPASMQPHLRIGLLAIGSICILALWQIVFSPPTPHSSSIERTDASLPSATISSPESAEAHTVLDLFSPPEGGSNDPIAQKQASIENTLLITFLLTHCEVISRSEYAETFHALVLYGAGGSTSPSAIAQSNQIAQEKAKSAAARYTMLYGRLPCDRSKLEPQAQRLKTWRQLILKRKTP